MSLPRDLPVQIAAHGALLQARGFNTRQGAYSHSPGLIPDVPVLYLNALGLALAAAKLPLRGGLLACTRVMKRGEAGQVCQVRILKPHVVSR
jgi:hypothetical protein